MDEENKKDTASDNEGLIFLSKLVYLVEKKKRGMTGKSLQLSIRNAAKDYEYLRIIYHL